MGGDRLLYLPLLDVLDAAPVRVTLSVTPVLGDQLEAPGALDRCLAFLREIRPASHALDMAAATPGERAALEHGGALRGGGGRARPRRPRGEDGRARDLDLVGDARDPAAARHRRGDPAAGRDGHRGAPRAIRRLGRRLLAAGVRARAVARPAARGGGRAPDVRGPDRRGAGCPRPAALAGGPAARPARPAGARARLEPRGLPLAGRVPRHAPAHGAPPPGVGGRRHGLRPGARGGAGARGRSGVRGGGPVAPGLCCVAWDTELLGLHWHEGARFLAAVLEEAEAAGLRMAPLDELAAEPEAGSGAGGDRRRDVVGRAADARHVERAAGRRARVAPAPGGVADAPGRLAYARCASCWRSSPPTGPS